MGGLAGLRKGVDTSRVSVQDGAALGVGLGVLLFRDAGKPNRPQVNVGAQRGFAEVLAQTSGPDAPPEFHLPVAVLGMDVTLGHEQIMAGGGVDVRDAVRIAVDFDRPIEPSQLNCPACLGERPAGEAQPDAAKDQDHSQNCATGKGGSSHPFAHLVFSCGLCHRCVKLPAIVSPPIGLENKRRLIRA